MYSVRLILCRICNSFEYLMYLYDPACINYCHHFILRLMLIALAVVLRVTLWNFHIFIIADEISDCKSKSLFSHTYLKIYTCFNLQKRHAML